MALGVPILKHFRVVIPQFAHLPEAHGLSHTGPQTMVLILPTVKILHTVELQWLEHLWDHENEFETGVVRGNEGCLQRQVRRLNMDIFLIFLNMRVCCVFSLESPHRGDSNEYTQYTIFNIKQKSPYIILNLQL